MDFLEKSLRFYSKRYPLTLGKKKSYSHGENFVKQVKKIFGDHKSLWHILYEEDDIGFYYSLNDQEFNNIETAYNILIEKEHGGAQKHLVAATKHFGEAKWADSIRESIHAVESVCKRIADNPNATLADALNALKSKDIQIHPALKAGLDKIYAYTSDEKGIRHASIDFDTNCDQADAQFMLGACASFISYLCQKAEIA